MATIDHVTLRVGDLAAALALHTLSFEVLEFAGRRTDGERGHEWNDFSIAAADADHAATRGAHVAFAARSRAQVDAWWHALTSAGHPDDGPPGPRPQYTPDYYGAFVRDADGNSLEAVHHERSTPETAVIDHLWIRVADIEVTKRFYAAAAGAAGAGARDVDERLQVRTATGSFMLLEGPPTSNLHLAFGVDDAGAVRTFHRYALAAGGRDDGAPRERPHDHAGYVAASVLDPDGNSVEAVWRARP